MQYRAWGAVKAASFGDGSSETVQFNSRLQPTQFRLTFTDPYQNYVRKMRDDYSYYDDGRLKQFTDLDDTTMVEYHYMSRAYSYDHSARVKSAGQATGTNILPPFSANYGYDPFNNMTSRSGRYGLQQEGPGDAATYTDNRRVQTGWSYDADGRILTSADTNSSSSRTWSYDAAGEVTSVAETAGSTTTTNTMAYDGNGQMVFESVATISDYLIRSVVLGGAVLTRLDSSGAKSITYVPANGLVAPLQYNNNGTQWIDWVHRDALGVQENSGAYDPLGNLIGNQQPPAGGGPAPTGPLYGPGYGGASWSFFSNANNFSTGCYSAANNTPAACNDRMLEIMGPAFVSNLPGQHADLSSGENDYISRLNGKYDNPGNGTGVLWLPPDDSIPGRFGNFVLVTPHVAPGSRFGNENPYAPTPQNPSQPSAQNPSQPSAKGFPCPPSVAEVLTGRDQESVGKELTAAGERYRETGREQGGWIYMGRNGRLKAVSLEAGGQNTGGMMQIVLDDPPVIKGYIVVVTFHTHDLDMNPSEPTGEELSLSNDIWTNEAQRVPGIIVGAGLVLGFNGYGPKRGYWRQRLPRRCNK